MKTEIRSKKVEQEIEERVYIAHDGKEFKTADECINYEKKTTNLKILSELKSFKSGEKAWYFIKNEKDLSHLISYCQSCEGEGTNINYTITNIYGNTKLLSEENRKELLNTWVAIVSKISSPFSYYVIYEFMSFKQIFNQVSNLAIKINNAMEE